MLKPPQADTDMEYWDLEMTVEEPLSDDDDGVPHGVSDSESEFDQDSDEIFASCDTEGICFFFVVLPGVHVFCPTAKSV
jgi:hypothetical protein